GSRAEVAAVTSRPSADRTHLLRLQAAGSGAAEYSDATRTTCSECRQLVDSLDSRTQNIRSMALSRDRGWRPCIRRAAAEAQGSPVLTPRACERLLAASQGRSRAISS